MAALASQLWVLREHSSLSSKEKEEEDAVKSSNSNNKTYPVQLRANIDHYNG